MKALLLATLIFFAPGFAKADDYHAFIGAGAGYGLGTVRLGMNNFEFGYVSSALVFDKILFSDKWYLSIGPAYTLGETRGGFGLFGSAGFDFNLFWILKLRGELFAIGDDGGNTRGGALLGLELRF